MKISIIGAGKLGSLFAYTFASRGLASEIVLVDVIKELSEGQAADLSHSMAHRSDVRIRAGDYKLIKGSDVVVITAGKPRAPGMTRIQLAETNAPIVSSIAQEIDKRAPESIIITLTNPMDLMNYVAYRKSGFEREKVIGSGGQLDSSRFISVLAHRFKVAPTEVNAYVLGEHGEAQAPYFSGVHIGKDKKEFSLEDKKEICEAVRKSAIEVIEKKRATEYAPAACTADMIASIVQNEKTIIPCSTILKGEYGLKDMSIGVPVVLGRDGIETILEWPMDEFERELFMKGADTLSAGWKQVGKLI